MKLWVKILLALSSGALCGILIHNEWLPQILTELLEPIGSIFMSLISMIIMLLVFSSMTVGITSIHDPQKLGRVGLKSLTLYLITTLIAIVMGLSFAKLLQPGIGITFQTSIEASTSVTAPSIKEMLLSVIPSNPIASFASGNVLQVIVFSLFLGMSINFAGDRGKPFLEMLESLADVMFRMTSMIMEFSPIGVFAIMATVTATFGGEVLLHLTKLVTTFYIAATVHGIIVICGMLYILGGLNPIPFFRGMGDAIVMAFSTCSSSATLPITMHCAQKNLGISKNISNFVIPLGTSINMNGAALYQGMSAVFISQVYGIELGWQNLFTIVIAATLSSIGTAGIPGSGFIMMSMVFTAVGLPLEGLPLLLSIDRIREMMSTVLNILADAACAVYVAQQEGELDLRQYNCEGVFELENSEI